MVLGMIATIFTIRYSPDSDVTGIVSATVKPVAKDAAQIVSAASAKLAHLKALATSKDVGTYKDKNVILSWQYKRSAIFAIYEVVCNTLGIEPWGKLNNVALNAAALIGVEAGLATLKVTDATTTRTLCKGELKSQGATGYIAFVTAGFTPTSRRYKDAEGFRKNHTKYHKTQADLKTAKLATITTEAKKIIASAQTTLRAQGKVIAPTSVSKGVKDTVQVNTPKLPLPKFANVTPLNRLLQPTTATAEVKPVAKDTRETLDMSASSATHSLPEIK